MNFLLAEETYPNINFGKVFMVILKLIYKTMEKKLKNIFVFPLNWLKNKNQIESNLEQFELKINNYSNLRQENL